MDGAQANSASQAKIARRGGADKKDSYTSCYSLLARENENGAKRGRGEGGRCDSRRGHQQRMKGHVKQTPSLLRRSAWGQRICKYDIDTRSTRPGAEERIAFICERTVTHIETSRRWGRDGKQVLAVRDTLAGRTRVTTSD
eukprot:2573169-Amphidinium_carterae.1